MHKIGNRVTWSCWIKVRCFLNPFSCVITWTTSKISVILSYTRNRCLLWESYKNRQNTTLTKIWTSCSLKNSVRAKHSLPYLSPLFAEVPLFASHTTLSADVLLGRWCGAPSDQPTAVPCRSICNRTKKTVTVI